MVVLDANILIRAVLGRRVRELIDAYAAQGVRFFAPDVAFADAEKYLPPLLKKRGKPHDLSGPSAHGLPHTTSTFTRCPDAEAIRASQVSSGASSASASAT